MDDVFDVVGQVGFDRHDRIELRIHPVDRVRRGSTWRIIAVVLRQIAQQLANHAQTGGVILRDEMADAADGVVRGRPA